MSTDAIHSTLHRRPAGLVAVFATLALGACSTTPDAEQRAAAERVESAFIAALEAPALKEGDVEHDLAATAAGDFWDTGTLASVDDDGNLVYLVPTTLIERNGEDAYAGRRGPRERERNPNALVTLDLQSYNQSQLLPNGMRNGLNRQMLLGASAVPRPQRPQATPAPAPRPTTRSSSRSRRSSVSSSRQARD